MCSCSWLYGKYGIWKCGKKLESNLPVWTNGPQAGNLSLINGVIGSVAYKSGPSEVEGLWGLIFPPLPEIGRPVSCLNRGRGGQITPTTLLPQDFETFLRPWKAFANRKPLFTVILQENYLGQKEICRKEIRICHISSIFDKCSILL